MCYTSTDGHFLANIMYSKILVPLDGSQLSETILPYVRTIAGALKVPVELLIAIEPSAFSAKGQTDPQKANADYLNRVATSFREPKSVVSSVEFGNPAEVIVGKASLLPDALIAMSTRGRSGIQRWMMGSVADKVLHATTSPLLLLRGEADNKSSGEAPLSKVIVPLDGSPLAEKALPQVLELATKIKMEVVVVRAPAAPRAAIVDQDGDPEFQKIAKEIVKEAETYLEAKTNELQAKGLKASSLLLDGEAAGEIIDLARKTPSNLVAISTHGWSGIGRWILGNITERVVRHCGDPVLIIR